MVKESGKKAAECLSSLVTFLALSLLFTVTGTSPLSADVAPAGQVISSVSTAGYRLGGSECWISSNEVSLSVLPFYRPQVVPDGTVSNPAAVASTFSGGRVVFPFQVSNLGNDMDSYRLSVSVLSPSDFVPTVNIYLDVDGDSALDEGEPEIGDVGPLDPAQGVNVLLAARLPEGLIGGETAHLSLEAVSFADTTSVDGDNVVRITAMDEARVSVVLSSDESDVMPGEEVTYHVEFSNVGDRSAVDVVVSDFIDYGGMVEGAVYRSGSAAADYPGRIEYLDKRVLEWSDVEPPPEYVGGVRLVVESLPPDAEGELTFTVDVDESREAGAMLNAAVARFTGGNSVAYELSSNEVVVTVGMAARVAIGPRGNPLAPPGSDDDVVRNTINGVDSAYCFWHEVYNGGNFTDTVVVSLVDSIELPDGWSFVFVDSSGAPLTAENVFSCSLPPLPIGGSVIVGARYAAAPFEFTSFRGRTKAFSISARSRPFPDSTDTVEDLFIKGDIPVVSIVQSIKEPTAMPGDVISFLVTVRNVTDGTVVDSAVVEERLGEGLHYAAGDTPLEVGGGAVLWNLGRLGPGEKKTIVFQATVGAGQEWGRLTSSAWVYGWTEAGDRVDDGPAVASVRIVDGIFSRKGLIFGGVFEDRDMDGDWGGDERGVAGVDIYLEDGTQVVTDSSGYYSIPLVEEGTHLLRVDPASVPDSLWFGEGGYYGVGSEGEALVVLSPSGNKRVDFALVPARGRNAVGRENAMDGRGGRFETHNPGTGPATDGDVVPTGAYGGGTNQGGYSNGGIVPIGPGGLENGPVMDTSIVRGGNDTGFEEDSLFMFHRSSTFDSSRGDRLESDMVVEKRTPQYGAITIPSTHFAEGSSELEDIPIREIAALSLWLREHPGWKVVVEGHTDSIPVSNERFPSNLELSLSRARSVYQILLMNGIPKDRVDYNGYGADRPVASNSTAEGRARNRRVEIKVIPPEGYLEGDPHLELSLPGMVEKEKGFPSLSDSSGICADIVRPEEGRVFRARDRIDVEVLAPLGSGVDLYVNNVPVGRERIGKKTIDTGRGVAGFVFYGVRIREGENEILVVCKHHGGERNTCVRHVYLAGRPSRCIAERETVEIPADGRSTDELVFLVSDENGLPVRDGIFATVEPGEFLSSLDENPDQNGVQVATGGGRIVLRMPPSSERRTERVEVSMGGVKASCRVRYVSAAKGTFVFGFGDGSIGYGDLSSRNGVHNTFESFHEGLYAEGRLSMFGWGEVAPGHVLTCAVNTRPVREDRLFARVNVDRAQPIYGDASELKFHARSREGTFVNLRSKSYSVTFGDFRTDFGSMEFNRYGRAFNGLKWYADILDGVALQGFVTNTDQITYQEEIPGEGTSGFYFLEHYPLVENSEKVRIEVRDRYRPEKIVRVDFKQVNRDYDINYLDGSILFKEPVPSRDEDLNPVYIVVSYECRNSSSENLVYGVRSELAVTDSLKFHAMGVLEEEGVENSSIAGIDVDGAVPGGFHVSGEFTHSEKFELGSANAYRLRLSGPRTSRFRWSTYYRNVDRNFYNPSFTGGKTELGSRKFGADLDWRVNKELSLASKSYTHRFIERNERKGYLDLVARYRKGDLRGKAGFAGVNRESSGESERSSVLLVSSIAGERGRVKGELQWDQIITGEEVQEYPNRLQGNLSARLWKKLYAAVKHEYRTGVSSGTRHLTQFGIERGRNGKVQLYSRYRIEGAASGERGMAIAGMKERFSLGDALAGTFSLEKQATVSGARLNDFFSVATACSYAPPGGAYRVKGNYEFRVEPERYKHLAGVSGIKRLGDRFSYMLKGELWFDDEKYEADRVKGRGEAAFALRPRAADRLAVFTLLRGTYDRNSPAHPEGVDREFLLSLEGNYAIDEDWQVEGKFAGRWLKKTFRSYTSCSSTYLYQGEIVRVIGGVWDVRLRGRVVHQVESSSIYYGGDLEGGRALTGNLWLGVGYGFAGRSKPAPAASDFTARGFYVRMRCKFTEKIMAHFMGE